MRQTESGKLDLIIIPGFCSDVHDPVSGNMPIVEWMKDQYQSNGSELASMCTGAFLIAATGLLDGKSCTTHWAFTEIFRQTFRKHTGFSPSGYRNKFRIR